MNSELTLLDAILSAKPAEPQSMQVFDAIALACRLDAQVRTLAQTALQSQQLTIDIDTSTDKTYDIQVAGEAFARISILTGTNGKNIAVTLANRAPWQARAYSITDGVKTTWLATVIGNTITVSNVNMSNCTIQFI